MTGCGEEKINKKLASKAAVICYSFGDLASQFVWTFVGSYLTIYYTDIVGLAPAAVSAIMLIARIWDAVNDPMMGVLAERSGFKAGRFRPFIAMGCPILALFSALTFTNPWGGGTAGVIWAGAVYIIAGMAYTFTNIPYGALAGVMTEDAQQRNRINTSRNIGMNVGMIIVNALSPVLLLKFSGPGAEMAVGRGYTMTAVVYSVISIPLFLLVFFTARENVRPVHRTDKVNIRDTIKNLVKNKYLMIILLIMTAFMGRLAVISYYVIYCLGSFSLISLIMTIPSVGSIISSFFLPFLVKRMGKRNLLAVSTVISGLGLLLIYSAPFDCIPMVIAGCGVFGLSNIGMPLTLSMVTDAVDYMELKTGIRTEGSAYATYGLATKLGNALGSAVGVLLLSFFGYAAKQQQTEAAMHGINVVVNLLPAVLYFAAAACCFLWKMCDKDAEQIREKLKERDTA